MPERVERRGIVPAVHHLFVHQPLEKTLAHDGVREVEPRELYLSRPRIETTVLRHPVVKGAVVLELQRTQRMRDTLDRVLQGMREIVHGIDHPLPARMRMFRMADAVDDGIAHVDVGRRHVDLRAEHFLPVREFARSHARKEVEVLLHAAVAVRALLSGFGESAARGPDLVGGQIAHIRLAVFYELHRALVHLSEIVGGVQLSVPFETEPADVLLNALHILDVLLDGIGVVETEIAFAAEFFLDAEIDAYRFRVPDVQIPVGLRGEARDDLVVFARPEIVDYDVLDEIGRFGNVHVLVHLRPAEK